VTPGRIPRTGARIPVLVVLHEDVPGGATLSIVRLEALLAQHGWRLVFWTSRPSPLYEELRSRGLEEIGRAHV